MSYSIIDTHCHLDIIESQGQTVSESLKKAKSAGVQKIIQIGIDPERNRKAKEISSSFSSELDIFYTLGCHPADYLEISEKDSETVLSQISESISDPKMAGIGEIGLDYYHDKTNMEGQKIRFRQYLEKSIELNCPVVIHSRDAAEDTYSILKEYSGKARGVIHCFTYDTEYALKFFNLGYFISFSGILTFNSAKEIQKAASAVPLEGILIETDAPFLAPTPHRGRRNEPAYMPQILEKLFSLRDESNIEVEEKIYENSLKFIERKGI
ncbi:MAG TPA: TatD family hydrolase [Leptospiraceae bacterium]|nr:TatD family hydrolase [Leptospiraceae bacterium]